MRPRVKNLERLQQALKEAEKISLGQLTSYPTPSALAELRLRNLEKIKRQVQQQKNVSNDRSQHFSGNGMEGQKWNSLKSMPIIAQQSQVREALESKYELIVQNYRQNFKSSRQNSSINLSKQSKQSQKAPVADIFKPIFSKQTGPTVFNNAFLKNNNGSSSGAVLNATPQFQERPSVAMPTKNIFGNVNGNADKSLFGNSIVAEKSVVQPLPPNSALFKEANPLSKIQPDKTGMSLFTNKNQPEKTVPAIFNNSKDQVVLPKVNIFSKTLTVEEPPLVEPLKPSSNLFSIQNPWNANETKSADLQQKPNLFFNKKPEINKEVVPNKPIQNKPQQQESISKPENEALIFSNPLFNKPNIFEGVQKKQVSENKNSPILFNKPMISILSPQKSNSDKQQAAKPAVEKANIFSTVPNPQSQPQSLILNEPYKSGSLFTNFNSEGLKKQKEEFLPVKTNFFAGQAGKNTESSEGSKNIFLSKPLPNNLLQKPGNPFDKKKENIFEKLADNPFSNAGKVSKMEEKEDGEQFEPKKQPIKDSEQNIFGDQSKSKPLFSLKPVEVQSSDNQIKEPASVAPGAEQVKNNSNSNFFTSKYSSKESEGSKKSVSQLFSDIKSKPNIFGNIGTPNQSGSIFGAVPKTLFGGSKPDEKNPTIFGSITSGGSLFENKSKPLFQNKVKKNEDEDEEEDEEDDDGPIEDIEEIDPTKSTGNYKYEQTQVLFKQNASKFRRGNTDGIIQNVVVSIEKVPENKHKVIYIRLSGNKCISFYGTFIPGTTEVSAIQEGSYRNISVKKIVTTNKQSKPSFQLLKIQFKDDKQGKKFIDILESKE